MASRDETSPSRRGGPPPPDAETKTSPEPSGSRAPRRTPRAPQDAADAAALEHARERLDLALRAADMGSWSIDLRTGEVHWDAHMGSLFGFEGGVGSPAPVEVWTEFVHPEDRERVQREMAEAIRGQDRFVIEFRSVSPGRGERVLQARGQTHRDRHGRPVRLVGVTSDISDRRETELRIHRLAFYDPLTGLANRRAFEEELARVLAKARSERSLVALFYVDLDRFKRVNDTAGHAVGDALLRAAAERLVACVRQDDVVARVEGADDLRAVSRIGGDEFTVLVPGLASPEAADGIARRILDAFEEPFCVAGTELHVSTSIGIALFPIDARNADSLQQQADTALYTAKQAGRNEVRFFTPPMNEGIHRRLRLETLLRRALDEGGLRALYQPIVDAATWRPIGVEALLRVDDPDEGVIGPGEFIPVAEETGLIHGIGEWILHTACDQARIWREAGIPLQLSVNVSAVQLRKRRFVATLLDALETAELEPWSLVLEVTESAILDDREPLIERLRKIRSMDVGIALDDFGTGYSSLTWLRRFPITRLKIDRSFIREIATSWVDARLTEAIVRMARTLGRVVVAEGVEEVRQAEILRDLGCHALQGYLFARPLSAAALEAWLRDPPRPGGTERKSEPEGEG